MKTFLLFASLFVAAYAFSGEQNDSAQRRRQYPAERQQYPEGQFEKKSNFSAKFFPRNYTQQYQYEQYPQQYQYQQYQYPLQQDQQQQGQQQQGQQEQFNSIGKVYFQRYFDESELRGSLHKDHVRKAFKSFFKREVPNFFFNSGYYYQKDSGTEYEYSVNVPKDGFYKVVAFYPISFPVKFFVYKA